VFHNLIASSTEGELILQWIEKAALAIEVLAVMIIIVAIFFSMARYSYQAVVHPKWQLGSRYGQLKASLGRSLLLGLEILVAADIVRTVALEATLALVVEIEGRWPWQPPREE
jgi:uncharacterized membrane protein